MSNEPNEAEIELAREIVLRTVLPISEMPRVAGILAAHRRNDGELAKALEAERQQLVQLVDWFAKEYPGAEEKTTLIDKLSVILNCHIADRYKNGICFIGFDSGNPTFEWIADAKSAEDARAALAARKGE